MALYFLYLAFLRLFQLLRLQGNDATDLAVEVVMLRRVASVLRREVARPALRPFRSRPASPARTVALVVRLTKKKPNWGYRRIQEELATMDHDRPIERLGHLEAPRHRARGLVTPTKQTRSLRPKIAGAVVPI